MMFGFLCRRIGIKLLFFLVTLAVGLKSYADAEINVHLTSNVAVTASLERNTTGENLSSSMIPSENGRLSSEIKFSYDLTTNGTGADQFDFYITAKLTDPDTEDAFALYGDSIKLLLGNTATGLTPDSTSIANVRNGIAGDNVVAFNTNVTFSNTSSGSTFTRTALNSGDYGPCWLIKAYNTSGGDTTGTITFSVPAAVPVGTYNILRLQPGSYKAKITITAKPLI